MALRHASALVKGMRFGHVCRHTGTLLNILGGERVIGSFA